MHEIEEDWAKRGLRPKYVYVDPPLRKVNSNFNLIF